MKRVYIVEAVRTAVGAFGGSLKDIPPTDLATTVASEALKRSAIDPAEIGHVVFGMVIPGDVKDPYVSRVAAVNAGIPHSTPAFTVNRLCGSGIQAVICAAQAIMLGDAEVALAGGAESMSRAPFNLPGMRWGARLGDSTVVDMLLGTLNDPFNRIHMGITAENVAERYGVSREEQDRTAYHSHRKAAHATKSGYFAEQIVPIEIKSRKGPVMFTQDEHIRFDVDEGGFAGLKPAFKKDGTVTAGNASGINDGASAVILASEEAVNRLGLKPMAALVSYGYAGVDPAYMGIGPVEATRQALRRAGLTVGDLQVVESNEAFAAQACAVTKELKLDPEIVNPNGSGIAIGHPVGATGAINTTKLVHEMKRTGAERGLVTMCIGGGQGIAAVFERV